MNKYCMVLVFFDEQFQLFYVRKIWICLGDMNFFMFYLSFVLCFFVNSQVILIFFFIKFVDKKVIYFDFEVVQVFCI